MPEQNESVVNPIDRPSAGLLTQPAQKSAIQGSKEHRSAQRFYVKWRTLAFIDAKSQHQGFIKDISTKGAAVFLDRNLQPLEFIKLHIHVPPPDAAKSTRIVEVYGKIIYTTHDNSELLFRVGISFLKFASADDPVFLETYLTNYQTKII